MTRTTSTILLAVFAQAACAGAFTVTDAVGRAVGFAEPPRRIAVAGRASFMVADAVYLFPGARSRVVAVGGADQGLGVFLEALDPDYAAKPVLDRAAGAEAYAALRPDLVVMKSSMRKSVGPGLDALGIAQLYLDLETPEDYLRELALLGSVLGESERASALVEYYRNAMRDTEVRVAKVPQAERFRVLVLQAQSQAGGSYEVPPASWMQTILVERAGGIPVWKGANPGSGWARVGPEQIAAWDPQVILVISYRESSSKAAAALAADSRLSFVRAVRAGTVFAFPQDFYSWDQPDTRWILGLRWAARTMYPRQFQDTSSFEELEDFFSFCYGLDSIRFEALIESRLSGDYAIWER